MKNFKELWKTKADNKNISCQDIIELCIIKTIHAKSEQKKEILEYYIKKAFTPAKIRPHMPYPFYTPYLECKKLHYKFSWGRKTLFANDVLESPEEFDMYYNLLKGLYNDFTSY